MDPRSQELFDKITAKPIEELTEDDKVFLRARRSYLKPSQKKDYADIIEEEKPPLYVADKDKKNHTSDSETVKEDAKDSK